MSQEYKFITISHTYHSYADNLTYQVCPLQSYLGNSKDYVEVRMYTQYPRKWVLTFANFPLLKVSTNFKWWVHNIVEFCVSVKYSTYQILY